METYFESLQRKIREAELKGLRRTKLKLFPVTTNSAGQQVKFQCLHCNYAHSKEAIFLAHVKREHEGDPRPFHCKLCSFHAPTSTALISHFHNMHEPVHLKCIRCDQKLETWEAYRLHCQVHHRRHLKFKQIDRQVKRSLKRLAVIDENLHQGKVNPYVCVLCPKGRGFPHQFMLVEHVKEMHTGLIDCPYDGCSELFKNVSERSAHVKEVHLQNSGFYCSNRLGQDFNSSGLMQNSFFKERKALFMCPRIGCSSILMSAAALDYHIEGSHNDSLEVLQCHLCAEFFHSTALLKEHMACHAVNPFLCTRCSFTGNTEASLWNHGNDVHRESIEESSNCNKKTIAHQALSDRKFKLMPAYGADEKNATVDVCDAQMLALKHTADPAIELKGICAVCGVEGGMFAETGTAPATISCIKCLGSLKSQSFPDPPTISGMKTEDHSSVEDFNLVHCSDLETMSQADSGEALANEKPRSLKNEGRRRRISATRPKINGPAPCNVCGESTQRFSFGILCCIPCQAFLRKYLKRRTTYSCQKGGDCVINQSNRSCNFCRLQKCKAAGLLDTRGALETLPISSSPCCVCGDVAFEMVYGAPHGCNSCRFFFQDSVRKSLEFKCGFGGKCAIMKETRAKCKACRYNKCLQVGMKREAVKVAWKEKP